MPLETATHIVSLVITNPDGSDQKNTADDHIRLIKACLKRTFPLLDGAVSLSHTQLMLLSDLSASVQLQLNQLRDGSATANNALFANSASAASVASNALSLGGVAAAGYARLSLSDVVFIGALETQGNGQGVGIGAQLRFISGYAEVLSFDWTGGGYQPLNLNAGAIFIGRDHTQSTRAQSVGVYANGGVNSFTFNGFTVWHAGNDGDGSGLNADVVRGAAPAQAAAGNTIATRTSGGDLFAVYFNSSSTEGENPNVNSIFVSNGDGYHRKATPSYLGTLMQTRNISGKNGTQKTISGSSPAGGNDGDIWYQI